MAEDPAETQSNQTLMDISSDSDLRGENFEGCSEGRLVVVRLATALVVKRDTGYNRKQGVKQGHSAYKKRFTCC